MERWFGMLNKWGKYEQEFADAGKTKTYQCITTIYFFVLSNSQQPIDSNQQTDVLGWQAYSGQDQQHSHQAGTGNTGCSNTGQGGCQTGWRDSKVALDHTSPKPATHNHVLHNSPLHPASTLQTPVRVNSLHLIAAGEDIHFLWCSCKEQQLKSTRVGTPLHIKRSLNVRDAVLIWGFVDWCAIKMSGWRSSVLNSLY